MARGATFGRRGDPRNVASHRWKRWIRQASADAMPHCVAVTSWTTTTSAVPPVSRISSDE